MNLTSFLINKCFEYLLDSDSKEGARFNPVVHTSTPGTNSSEYLPISPPWSHKEKLFRSTCDGCGACFSSCENNILIPDKDGFPQVDFSAGSCSFCGACAESCPNGAFSHDPYSSPWSHTASITRNCLAHSNVLCRTCAEHCEEEAIIIPRANGSISPPRILADMCNGCGACFGPCPARAITFIDSAESEK